MKNFMTVREAAKKWNLSERAVQLLCQAGRIDGTARVGRNWILPEDAEKPADQRVKSGNYSQLRISKVGMVRDKKETSYVNLGEESEYVEFKKSTGELKEAMSSIVAILNKHGRGDLYFGVRNDGTVIGMVINDQSMRQVSQAVGNHINPVIYPEITKELLGNRAVIHVHFEGHNRPYTAYHIPRIRVADEDLVMSQDVYDDMIRERSDFTNAWENRVSRYHLSELDYKAFSAYLRRAKEVERITFESEEPRAVLNKLGLMEGDMLLNAGAALFVDSSINDLQMAKFASDEKVTFTDIRRSTGSILSLIEIALQYLIDAMDWRADFGDTYRKEIPEVPVEALREAVVNAFAHRDIESGQSIQIMIFRNRIEIYSPGTFPDRISPEEFAQGDKKAIRRNKLITQTLYYSKDMETFATGLQKIKRLCTQFDVHYEFREEEYGFSVIFFRHCGTGWESGDAHIQETNDKAAIEAKEADSEAEEAKMKLIEADFEAKEAKMRLIEADNEDKEAEDESGETKNEANQDKQSFDTEKISALDSKMLTILAAVPDMTQAQLATQTGVSRTTVQRRIKVLINTGKIRRVGSPRSGHWEVL